MQNIVYSEKLANPRRKALDSNKKSLMLMTIIEVFPSMKADHYARTTDKFECF